MKHTFQSVTSFQGSRIEGVHCISWSVYVLSYHIKRDDWFWEVGILLRILDVLGADHGAPALHLNQRARHVRQLETLHVTDSPAQDLQQENSAAYSIPLTPD